jgi:hypothetical protein
MVADGVVSVSDLHKTLRWGPGLRRGIVGRVLLHHMG